MQQNLKTGLITALGAYFIWGSLPLYIRAFEHLGAMEFLAHRILWSVPTAVILIILARNWEAVRSALTWSRFGWLCLSGFLIGANWLTYIWAVNADRTMEAALGYYINPLVNVVFGLLFFSENLRRVQWLSVAIAFIGVSVVTIAFGRIPWAAIVLCMTFALYSVIRKQVQIDSRVGFLIEVMILLPPTLIWFTWFLTTQDGTLFARGDWYIPLLVAAGPITAIPLILFGVAAKRLMLSTIGMLQYLGPTLQFLIATFVFKEPFGWIHGVAFGFIWTALILYTLDSVAHEARLHQGRDQKNPGSKGRNRGSA